MITYVGTTTTTSGKVKFTSHTYNTGIIWHDTDMIQVRETISVVCGRTLHCWTVMLERGICWIGGFRTARDALAFYCPEFKR